MPQLNPKDKHPDDVDILTLFKQLERKKPEESEELVELKLIQRPKISLLEKSEIVPAIINPKPYLAMDGNRYPTWDIRATHVSPLYLTPTEPVDAAWFTYYLVDIRWKSSGDSGIKDVACPNGAARAGDDFEFPEAGKHQIVPGSGPDDEPAVYWIGEYYCPLLGHRRTCRREDRHEKVFFGVNDSWYRDNSGGFTVALTAWGW